MDLKRITEIYESYVVSPGLERRVLLEAFRDVCPGSPTLLYPGCFVHVTPSFYFQHVVYVDRAPFPGEFFADLQNVSAFVDERRRYRPGAYLEFLGRDFTDEGDMPVRDGGHDALLSLYTGGVTVPCLRYLKTGGIVLTDSHHGESRDALSAPCLVLQSVIDLRHYRVRIVDTDLQGFLAGGASPGRKRRQPGRRDELEGTYFLFRKTA